MIFSPLEDVFQRTLQALGPRIRKNLVVVGGWCPYLYARYLWEKDVPVPRTTDIDFAVRSFRPDRFSRESYLALQRAHLAAKAIDLDDRNRTQFQFIHGRELVKIEFVTSPRVLPRGQKPLPAPYTACDPLPEVAIALEAPPTRVRIGSGPDEMDVWMAAPWAFLVMKALLVEHRAQTAKVDKDLESMAFVLQYAPDREALLQDIGRWAKHPAVREVRLILRRLFLGRRRRGIEMLAPRVAAWGVPPGRIVSVVDALFAPLIEVLERAR